MMKLLRVGAAARGASLTVMVLALVGGGVPLQAQDAESPLFSNPCGFVGRCIIDDETLVIRMLGAREAN